MIAVLFAGCLASPEPTTTSDLDPRIQQVLWWTQISMRGWQVPGVAIGVLEDGELTEAWGLGVRQRGHSAPITPQTRFRIGSLSKMFTASALLQLDAAGALSLDAPADAALSGVALLEPDALGQVSLRQLLSHSSGLQTTGLPNTCDVEAAGFEDTLDERSPDWVFWSEPDQFFNYANTGYALAGFAAQTASGQPFAELITETVFEPAGLDRTTYFREEAEEDGDFAIGHSIDVVTGEVVEYQDFSARYCAARFPSGGVISNIEDLGRFAAILMAGGGPGLDEAAFGEMTGTGWDFSETSRYGLGLQVTRYHDHPTLFHTGSLDGFQSLLWLLPDDGLGIIVLVNSDHTIGGVAAPWSKPTHRIAEYIAQVYLDDVPLALRDPPTLIPQDQWAERYVGTYRSEHDWGTVEIAEQDGDLVLISEEDGTELLQPYSADTFTIPTIGSDGRTYYPTLQFEVEDEDDQATWIFSSSGIAQRQPD
ncbi:MAG: CubicO group peptidase (beta-lactamase class C family) [Myxococcota bacterium]|jgi:CubicO group peptidase (beta-lactamase class C family)